MKRWLVLLFAAVTVAVLVTLAVRNAGTVGVDLVLFRPELPLALWLAIALCLGALLTLVCLIPGLWHQRRERRRMEKELASIRAECNHLRTLPLRDR